MNNLQRGLGKQFHHNTRLPRVFLFIIKHFSLMGVANKKFNLAFIIM